MRAATPGAARMAAAETALLSHRAFGDSLYIRDRLAATYQRRLRKLGQALPSAAHLASLLAQAPPTSQRQLTGDIVLRCAVQHAMCQLTLDEAYGLPLVQCTGLFQLAAKHLQAGRPGGPLVAQLPAIARLDQQHEEAEDGNDSHGSYIWHAWHTDTPYAGAFLNVIESNYGAPLLTPTPHERDLLRRGLRLLHTLLPGLSASALSHVQLVALFPVMGIWRGKASSSQFRLNGCIFLNQELIGNPWWLAEHLLHEALHQKLYDFRHGHSLLAPGHAREDARRVCSLWNAPDADNNHCWDVHRTLAAFHVYVQLALLCLKAEQHEAALTPVYGPIASHISGSRRAIDRARYLGEQLQAHMQAELGLAGQQMTDWLMNVLDVLDVQARPAGARLHLLLDLYQRQSRKLDIFLASGGAIDQAAMALQAAQETQATLAALQIGGRTLALHGLQASLKPDANWPQTRRMLLQTLLPLAECAEADDNKTEEKLSELLREMVQQSSRQLAALGVLG